MSEKIHHIFGPSGAERHLACPGSLIPFESRPAGDAAKEGTACHQLLENVLVGRKFGFSPDMFRGQQITGDTNKEGKPFLVDDAMIDAVNCFITTVFGTMKEYGIPEDNFKVEEYLVHPDVPENLFGGTCDFHAVGNGVLLVADLKYGVKQVLANSPQLIEYAILVLRNLPDHERESIKQVVTVVVQPRVGFGEPWSLYEVPEGILASTWEKLWASTQMYLQHKDQPEAPLEILSTGSHCTYCPKVGTCKAVIQDLHDVIVEAEQNTLRDLTGDDLAKQLLAFHEKADVVKAFYKTVDARLLELAQAGVEIPGKKMVAAYGNRAWGPDATKVDLNKTRNYLASKFGLPGKDLVEHKIKSPAQIEAMLKATKAFTKDSEARRWFEKLVVRELKGVKLVNASSKDPAISADSIKGLQKQLEQEFFNDATE